MALLRRKSANPEARMSLGDHFREFRNRTLIATGAIVAGAVIGWLIFDPVAIGSWDFKGVWNVLIQPIFDYRDEHPSAQIQPNFGQATQAFSLRIKISFFVGLILSSPVWLWQIWGFLVPGLTKKEKKVARLFIGSAVPLFIIGCIFGGLAIPAIIGALFGFTPADNITSNLIDATYYINFVTKFILLMGLSFLLPVILMALNTIRILPGRIMLKGWRVAVLVIAVFSAMMAPTPDPLAMFVILIPLMILYYGSCGLAIMLDKRREAKERPEWLDVDDEAQSEL
ncbi:twin-arginine translocase subunit TatC [Demetria terragena]|uniref:twin-arginine translocase subunit TatC n=1 Tax=Demetria terragena TaxID=63959 RepID=UPI000373E113|nr:twin-arginine translocase subunit TatC [Demetria terragena]